MKKILFFVVLSLLLACSSDERVIDNSASGLFVLTLSDEELPQISKHDINKNELIDEDIYLTSNAVTIDQKVDKIKAFRDYLYILQSEAQKILLLSRVDYSLQHTIDFSAEGFEPIDICFPNATDAYILCKDKVVIYDITVLEPAIVLDLEAEATAINCFGNQVFTANTNDNSVSIMDTRTRGISGKVDVNPRPIAVDILNNGETICVLCVGNGKLDDLERSFAYIDFIEIPTLTNSSQVPLQFDNISGTDIEPVELVVTKENWAYIAANDVFLRLDLQNRVDLQFLSRLNMRNLYFDEINEILFATEFRDGITYIYSLEDFNAQYLNIYQYNKPLAQIIRE